MGDNFIYIYAGLIMLMAGFLVFNNWKTMKKAREVYKEQNIKSYQVLDVTRKWLLFYAGMLVLVIVLLIFGEQSLEVMVISVGLIFIVVAELGGTLLRFKLFFNDKNFIYEGKVYRIKSIRKIQTTGKISKRTEVIMFDGTKIQMPKQFAMKLEELSKKK